MRKAVHLSIFISLFGLSQSQAEPPPCARPEAAQEILSCGLQHHPDIIRAEAQLSNLDAYIDFAKQRPNPEIESEATHQSDSDEPEIKLQAAYRHTFELGGKRSKRIARAEAQRQAIMAQVEARKAEVALDIVSNLFRLRHIQDDLHLLDEALDTFDTVIRQYRSRSVRTPEQEVSLNVFQLAKVDHELEKSSLIQQRNLLKKYFDLATGMDFAVILATLPPRRTVWPDLSVDISSVAAQSAAWRGAKAAVDLSRAEVDIAVTDARPDLSIGPLIELESGRGQDSRGLGGSLEMSLPLYNRNKGAIGLARNELNRAQLDLDLRERDLTATIQTLVENYTHAIAVLKKAPSISEIEKGHHNIEKFFDRGLVSGPLVIEGHRQLHEFVENLNEQEMAAIEALWAIRALQGRILEEKL